MWERNLDTGKWSEQIDQLPKDYYDGIKQDIQSVRLYSKCLSGSVYMMIDDFDNIYNTLEIDKLGYYIRSSYASINSPLRGPQIAINSSNYEEFYEKYLREYAFTIKNLFTPNKLINSESDNITLLDVATTEIIQDLSLFNQVRYIDGIRLLNGHKILIKDQISEVTLSAFIDEEDYFTNTVLVSNYYLKESNVLDKTYYYYNSDNGIYIYNDGLLIKQNNLSDYSTSYKMNISVNYGSQNSNKQFHLLRLKNNYYPMEGDNVEFSERHNWILRHRLDYNNVLDLNYYDIIESKETEVYDRVGNFTYSIPNRILAVGEFGAIINNQDKIDSTNDYNTSNIINTKYKVTLRSISESNDYYWTCGDEGTLLKIYKPTFGIERIDLGIYSQLTSVTFLDNLNGFVVGKFNKIFFTNDGGFRWRQLNYPEYDSYSYTKVKFKDLNNVYICGSTGLFLELTRDGDNWISYKRQIYKSLSDGDYVLVDDLFDMFIMDWTTIKSDTLVISNSSNNFADSLNFNIKISNLNYSTLEVDVVSKFSGNTTFEASEYYVGLSMSNQQGLIYSDINYYGNRPPFTNSQFSFFKLQNLSQYSKQLNLPILSNGNISDDVITLEARIYYNYNGNSNSLTQTYNLSTLTYSIIPTKSELVLLPTFDKVIVYDNQKKIYTENNFVYFEFGQEIGEIRTLTRPRNTTNAFIYIGADKTYYFDFKDIVNYGLTSSNYVNGTLVAGPDLYPNKLYSTDNRLYIVGNESLLSYIEYPSIGVDNLYVELDPDYKNRYKSRLLFLDYDIASKLNFFTDAGQYRLPSSVQIQKEEILPQQYFRFGKVITQRKPFPLPNYVIFQPSDLSNVGDIGLNFLNGISNGDPSNVDCIAFRQDDLLGQDTDTLLNDLVGKIITIRRDDNKSFYIRYTVTQLFRVQDNMKSYFVTPYDTNTNWYTIANINTAINEDYNPNTTYIDISLGMNDDPYLQMSSIVNHKSWIDYFKDSQKTFQYYTQMSEDKKVEFSTKFVYTPNSVDFSIPQNLITTNLSDIIKFAPSVVFGTSSEFFEGAEPIITTTSDQLTQPTTLSNYDLMIYKNIMIFKKDINDLSELGDYIRLESDVVDINLLVNRINYYYKPSGGSFNFFPTIPTIANNSTLEKYIYCFHTLNQNMINNLLSTTQSLNFKLLNKYVSTDDFIYKYDKHPISIAYKVSESDKDLVFSPRLNNLTAYYNLASEITSPSDTFTMSYKESFLDFGYTPNYSLLEYLKKIDSSIFTDGKKLNILPELYNLIASTPSTFTNSTVQIIPSDSTNKLYFSKDLKFEWDSLLIYTFIDIECYNNDNNFESTQRSLIVSKYFDVVTDSYVLEFHKKINLPDLTNGIKSFNLLSRNTLLQISQDLQVLNNIQRSDLNKSINSTFSFVNLENEVKFRFPTDSYLKSLVSDYDVQQSLSGIIYTDDSYNISMNIINVEKEIIYNFNAIIKNTNILGFNNKVTYALTQAPQDEFKVGDIIFVELSGNIGSSKYVNPQYQGMQTIIDIDNQFITTSMEYGANPTSNSSGTIKFIKKDPFLNYLPIDLYDIGSDKKPKQSVEILPEMVKLEKSTHSLTNVDPKKLKLKFVDGLFLQEIEEKFSWFLQADTSPAIIGKNENGLIWYQGVWKCGQWFTGTWRSGEWLSGDWYGGDWYSSRVKPGVSSVEISTTSIDNTLSKWQGGRWFGGNWYGGSWYDGRRYGGDWFGGVWFNGIWNEGDWYDGEFQGGIWVLGNWYGGKFNCDSKLAYWLDGTFQGGDFENGLWYNGQFGVENLLESSIVPRFGTRSLNTRVSIWHGGKWLNGEFHSVLNIDNTTLETIVSDFHNLTIWKTGLWLGGDFYGGIAYNIDFRGGIWHGGILEEIQVIGIDFVYPGTYSTNKIYVNGNFKFNTGDEIYIIDDDRNTDFSPLGNNTLPRKYRINKIDEIGNSQTALYLNYNLSNLTPAIDPVIGSQSWSDIDTGLRVVSHFESAYWKSGHWTNGYFEDGTFEGGIWYNGIMEGIMGV